MSYGQAEKPCNDFKHWFGNGTLCGRCAWHRNKHDAASLPLINEILFALIFDNEVVGYMKWSEEACNWLYCKTYNRDSIWVTEFESAYSEIELAYIYPLHQKITNP